MIQKRVVRLKIAQLNWQITFNIESISDIYAEKPNYNVGSAVKLSFGKKESTNQSAATVWKLTDDGDDDDELINEDDLLDESDKIKPNPTELRGDFMCNSISPWF